MYREISHSLLALAIAVILLHAVTPAHAEQTNDVEQQLAGDPDNISLLLSAGQTFLHEARTGESDLLDKAEKYLDKALSLAPDNPHVLVLHGSMLALKGRDARLPVMKMRHVQNGLKEMDRAVELAPMDFGIRHQRGAYCLNLPDLFERADTAVVDFEHILMMSERTPGSMSNDEIAGIKLNLAHAMIKTGDVDGARELLNGVLADPTGSEYKSKASAMLAEIDG